MQVQQLITSSRRTTPRTLIASQQKKWTLRKPLISRSGWIEEKEKDRSRSNRHPSRRRNTKLSSSVSGDVNKMKIRHDLSRLRSNVEAVFAVNPIYVEISIQRKDFFHSLYFSMSACIRPISAGPGLWMSSALLFRKPHKVS